MATSDAELLQRYVADGSEWAFEELVERHIDLVYSAALRQLRGDEASAKDVVQSVFVDLARKAPSLKKRVSLAGWLYISARFAAVRMLRSECRRRLREEEAAQMQEYSSTLVEISWSETHLVIEEVMDELKEADREVLILRFFQDRDFEDGWNSIRYLGGYCAQAR